MVTARALLYVGALVSMAGLVLMSPDPAIGGSLLLIAAALIALAARSDVASALGATGSLRRINWGLIAVAACCGGLGLVQLMR